MKTRKPTRPHCYRCGQRAIRRFQDRNLCLKCLGLVTRRESERKQLSLFARFQ